MMAIILAACGAEPPTTTEGAPPEVDEDERPDPEDVADAVAGAEEAQSAMDEILAEVEGLTGTERRERLIELAQVEDGPVSFYGSTNHDDIQPVLDNFEDATDLSTSLFRSGGPEVYARVLQEAQANYAGSDVIVVSVGDMQGLEDAGLLLEWEGPVREELVDDGQTATYAPIYLAVNLAAWNSDRVPDGEEPQSWEDVLTNYPGALAVEAANYYWFAMLVEYFQEENGWSEEEAIDFFREAVSNASVLRGHSVGAELTAAGEYDVHASLYLHHMPRFADAPLEYEPAVEPMTYIPFTIGINATTSRPASALLLTEFILSAEPEEGQELLAGVGRTPANTGITEGGLPAYEVRGVRPEIVTTERDKWEPLWQEITELAGSGN